jgi:hypothetical protein
MLPYKVGIGVCDAFSIFSMKIPLDFLAFVSNGVPWIIPRGKF